jgi:hypothetical protein
MMMEDIHDLMQGYVVMMAMTSGIKLQDDYNKLYNRITVRENGKVFLSIDDTKQFFNDLPPKRVLAVKFNLFRPWSLFRHEKKFDLLKNEEFFVKRDKNRFDFMFETNEELIEFLVRYVLIAEEEG